MLSPDLREALHRMSAAGGPAVERLLAAHGEELRTAATEASRDDGFLAPPSVVERYLEAASIPEGERVTARRALLARYALQLPGLLPSLALPPSIEALCTCEIERMVTRPATGDSAADKEGYVRDLGLVLGLSVPVGVVVVDLVPRRVGPRRFVRTIARTRSPAPAWRYLRDRTWGPWYISHLDLRYKAELNPDGWALHYRRVADLLARHRHIRGLFAVSWLFDPGVSRISPHLGFYHDIPVGGGAHVVYNGVTASDVLLATQKSPRRYTLVESGQWVPRTYTVLWPRRALLDWAARTSG